MDHSFSNKLLLIPLFQGFSRLDFLDIVAQTPFDFRTFPAGATLMEQGQESRNLGLLLGGGAWFCERSAKGTYEYAERINAPHIVQPEALFGLHNCYTHRVVAATEVQAVLMSKQSVSQLAQASLTFQLNLLNAICSEAQHRQRMLWHKPSDTPTGRFIQFLTCRSLRASGCKRLRIRMEDLAEELCTTRLQVSNMLRSLRQEGLLTHSRGIIDIPSLSRLCKEHGARL